MHDLDKVELQAAPRRWWWPVVLLGAPLVAAGMVTAWWYWPRATALPPPPPEIGPVTKRTSSPNVPTVRFSDITGKAGIQFVHANGAFGKKLLPETMGSGVALFDYDNDDRPDIFLVNSCSWPGHEGSAKPVPTLALYRNMGNGAFANVTAEAGLKLTLYGMGVAVGDYDNDGWTDLFVTAVGGDRLFHNESDGKTGRRFVDVTARAGVGGPGSWTGAGDLLKVNSPVYFPSSATFVDHDNDGLLDLFVCNYLTWAPAKDLELDFKLVGHGRAYGRPSAFEGTQCFLYRNKGDGRFDDVSVRAGINVLNLQGKPLGKSLGVLACDVDEDGWADLIVANDTVRNFFFHNKGDGTFAEIGERSGVAYAEGNARGAMGIDGAWYRPGRFGIIIGNFANEPDTFLSLNDPKHLSFSDMALALGIAGPSRMLLKFGAFFFDYDLDGRPDVLTCNGHLEPEIGLVQPGQTYKQPAQLFWNSGERRGFDVVHADRAGPDLFQAIVGRGSAFADIDGDGDLDVVLTENGGPARLLRNDGGTGHHWVRLQLVGDGKRSNRSAIGAVVTLESGGLVQRQQVTGGRGYLSQSELPLTFGLGKAGKVDKLTIRWPGKDLGASQVMTDLEVDRLHVIKQK